jgi:hypothetical protein
MPATKKIKMRLKQRKKIFCRITAAKFAELPNI